MFLCQCHSKKFFRLFIFAFIICEILVTLPLWGREFSGLPLVTHWFSLELKVKHLVQVFFRFSRLYIIFWPVSLAQLSHIFFQKKGRVLMAFVKIRLFDVLVREIPGPFGWKLYVKFQKTPIHGNFNKCCLRVSTQGSFSAD